MPLYLSQKHGVNPAIPKCFVCGKDKNMIILAGRMRGDKEAPKNAVWDEEPCAECKAQIDKGFCALIETKDGESHGKKTINIREGDNPYRTGRIHFASKEALAFLYNKPYEEISGVAFVEKSEMAQLTVHLMRYKDQCNLRGALIHIDSQISNIDIETAFGNYNEHNFLKHLFSEEGYKLSYKEEEWVVVYEDSVKACVFYCPEKLDHVSLEEGSGLVEKLIELNKLAAKVYEATEKKTT